MVRLEPDPEALKPSHSDLEALADIVREAAAHVEPKQPVIEVGRRGHLRVLRDPENENSDN